MFFCDIQQVLGIGIDIVILLVGFLLNNNSDAIVEGFQIKGARMSYVGGGINVKTFGQRFVGYVERVRALLK